MGGPAVETGSQAEAGGHERQYICVGVGVCICRGYDACLQRGERESRAVYFCRRLERVEKTEGGGELSNASAGVVIGSSLDICRWGESAARGMVGGDKNIAAVSQLHPRPRLTC